MKILVVDDSAKQREMAEKTLSEHELTIVATALEARELLSNNPDFDVVLTDLLMPGEKKGIGPQGFHHIGQEIPYGLGIALLAIKKGIKKVAIVSEGDHHDHPILWFCNSIRGKVFPGLHISTLNVCMRQEDYPDVDSPWEYKDWRRELKYLMEY
jgi:hypothetical protein